MSDRVDEVDLVLPALRLMAKQPGGFIATSRLIQELVEAIDPTGTDDEILRGRADTYFSQKARNLISHRFYPNSFIKKGYAEYDRGRHGIRITDAGRDLVETA